MTSLKLRAGMSPLLDLPLVVFEFQFEKSFSGLVISFTILFWSVDTLPFLLPKR